MGDREIGTKNPAEFDKVMDNSTIRNWKIKHKINRFAKQMFWHSCNYTLYTPVCIKLLHPIKWKYVFLKVTIKHILKQAAEFVE